MSLNKKPNRLINEKSPYLQQHAYNPVDWYPWGEEAFEKAKKENKPIFLSIGYSTCHWCHVMERESFENEEMAKLLNERFVSIKVDREERPDIDSIYMLVCQMMTGHGGWPLNVFLTPDQVPFYAGTYFPRESRYGMPGLKEVVMYLYEQYMNTPERITNVGNQIKEALQQSQKKVGYANLSNETIEKAFQYYKQSFDPVYGGFGEAPKFPMPHALLFLLKYYYFSKDKHALQMVVKTLDGLLQGGIYDHIGFGFSRYSVDEKFLVPHFEKMLYDNALLIMAYSEAYQITKEERFKTVVNEICTYVSRDLQQPEGGFYSAEDADSEGEEGKFYVWTKPEVIHILGDDLGRIFCEVYDITDEGNFEGKNIPNLIGADIEELAKKEGLTIEQLKRKLESARKSLFQYRNLRVRPFRDDKILTTWNGLMIAALAKAGRVFDNAQYLASAKKALQFIEKNLFINGRLMVRYRDGEVKNKGFIDDYAYLLWGYVELYESTLNPYYIHKGKDLLNDMFKFFWDELNGGFYFTGSDHEELLIRQKESYDGALPSGNSVAVLQMFKLARLTGDIKLEEKVHQLLQAFSQDLNEYPNGHAMMIQTVLLTIQPTKEVVIILSENDENVNSFIKHIQQNYYPNITLLAGSIKDLKQMAPFTNDYVMINNKSTVYVCENYHCHQPTNDLNQAYQFIIE